MIQQVLEVFLQIILEFTLELSAFVFIVFYFFDRKKNTIGRAILALVSILIVGFGLSFFYNAYGNTVWGRVFVYFTLFFLFILSAKFVFNEKFVPVIFYLGVAYAIQNIMYKTWLLFYVTIEQIGWDELWPNYLVIYHLLYYSFVVLFVIATGFVFQKFFHRNLSDRTFSKNILIVTLFCLLTTIVLCSFEDVTFERLSTVRTNHFDDPTLYYLRQSGNLLSIFSCILVLYLCSKSIVENHLEKEVEFLEHTIRQNKQQYEISKETIEMINVKCHDIKYQIRSLAGNGGISKEDLDKLENSINIYDSKFDTKNQMLNVLLWEKSLYCEQNNITFTCMIDGENFDFMDSGDLYCLFGNIIDNALEAVKQVKDTKKKVINITAKRRGNLILIDEDNYYSGKLKFEDGLPVTTKDDKNYHGFGMRSIKIIARKYDGEMTSSSANNIFHLSVILTDNTTK